MTKEKTLQIIYKAIDLLNEELHKKIEKIVKLVYSVQKDCSIRLS